MANNISETIEREEEKKRFLDSLREAPTHQAVVMLAERIFDIENSQKIQNHNSTAIANRLRKIEIAIIVFAVAGAKMAIFGQAATWDDIIQILKVLLGQ